MLKEFGLAERVILPWKTGVVEDKAREVDGEFVKEESTGLEWSK